MRKSLVALLLAAGATAFVANLALAAVGIDNGDNLSPKLMNSAMAKELQTRAARLGSSVGTVDTIYIGFTPGHHNTTNNWWSIYSGSDKFTPPPAGQGWHNPPKKGGMWDFEPPYADVGGDSLQGWWSVRNQMSGTGGLTIPDHLRPWRALDFGNLANHVFANNKRTFGVVGVWHVDGGNLVVPPASTNWGPPNPAETDGGVKWAPLAGTKSAWMGLRRHGDTSVSDPVTKNPFNEDVLALDWFTAVSNGGTDKKFPGYGGQMDQMLYRDIDLSGAGDSTLTVSFQYRTAMSTQYSTNNLTRTGWFVNDPLTVITGGAAPNFIQNNSTVATPPVDSLMVYVGAPAEGSVILSDGNTHTIFDPMRRWFGEVIRSNEGLYKQIFSIGGTNASTSSGDLVVPKSILTPLKAAGANKVRLVFRVKTNYLYDDELTVATGYSSGGVGAAIIDNVSVKKGTGGATVIGAFENATDIDNSTAGSVNTTVWRSTGKPPQAFHHVHQLNPSTGLVYQDLCGQPGNPARICDMQGQIVSAGDHDHNERSGGTFGTAEQEPFQGIFSPTIQFVGPVSGPNTIGLDASSVNTDAVATDDYYIDYELYTGIFDFFNQGNAWRFGFMSYPGANTLTGAGEHKRWGEVRFPGFIFFNPDKQCFRDLEAVKGNGLLRTTNASGIPDSCRIFLGTRQEAYRFGIPQSEWLDGAYWDNISLDIVDGEAGAPLSADIWQFYQDTFPANDNAGLVGTPTAFDTTTALVKSGINISPTTGNTNRFDVPGDTTVVIADGDSVRVDMVFRIFPGPGNYVTPSLGVNSPLKRVSNSATPAVATANSSNFWESYLANTGPTPGGSPAYNGPATTHPTASSGPLAGQKIWSPNAWNMARMDTADVNVFQMQGRGVVTPASSGLFMTAYHEAELNGAIRSNLGVARNICFVADTAQTVSTQTVICGSGALPPGIVYPPVWLSAPGSGYNGVSTTKEGTKIIPDGLLTPGSHVDYFFRRQDGTSTTVYFCPDTNTVSPQNTEGPSTDGHRWQEFSVLPDRWKSPSYTNPVLGTPGRGDACMLYVDQNDRRGNERTWVGVADSIGATRAEKYGANNGWHAAGDGDVNDPAGFVRKHAGQAGTTWDMYQVKASESLNTGPGSLGSRGGVSALSFNDNTNTQINGKTSRQGPSEAMLNAYYKILFVLTGDLNSSIFGPFNNKSQNDYKIMQDFLLKGTDTYPTPSRGFFAEGDGFVEANDASTAGFNFLTSYLGVELRNPSYLVESQNTNLSADILPTAEVDPGLTDIYGLRNACTFTLDVLDRTAGLSGETAEASFYEPVGGGAPYISGVVKHISATNPWISLVDGWNIAVLRARDEISDRGRLTYFYNVFSNVFSAICDVQGAPTITTDVPNNNDYRLFMSLSNNPVRSGSATVNFGLTKAERVKIQIFDVSGRLVRTLADRRFEAGNNHLTWDGADNVGHQVARGVYFVRSQHADSKFTGQSKLIVLK